MRRSRAGLLAAVAAGLAALLATTLWLKRQPSENSNTAAAEPPVTQAEATATVEPERPRPLPHESIRGLSLFEPYAGGCEWQYYDISEARRELIARLPADCAGIHVSWHPQGEAALLWITNDTDGLMAWLVDLVGGRAPLRLPVPPSDTAERLAFDRIGRPLAFVLAQEQEIRLEAWRFTGRDPAWEICESALAASDSLVDWNALDTFKPLSDPEQLAAWQSWRADVPPKPADPPRPMQRLLKKRLPRGVHAGDGAWRVWRRPGWTYELVQWFKRADPDEPTGLAFLDKNDRLTKLLAPFQARDFVDVSTEGVWLLLSDNISGMRPHLYDMTTGKLVFASNVAQETTFWPPIPPPAAR
jgi:hypothetical protein